MTDGLILPLLLLGAQTITVEQLPVVPSYTTIDWERLPDLPYRDPPQVTAPMNNYVKSQTRAARCRIQRRVADKRPALRVEVAVLVDPDDGVRTSVPRAVGCAPVEQYAAGLVAGFARNNLSTRAITTEQWYRATVTFVWTK